VGYAHRLKWWAQPTLRLDYLYRRSAVSFWLYRKNKEGKKELYIVDFPFMLLVVVLGLFIGLFVPRYMHDAPSIFQSSINFLITGVCILAVSKTPNFIKGKWASWGSREMNQVCKFFYYTGSEVAG